MCNGIYDSGMTEGAMFYVEDKGEYVQVELKGAHKPEGIDEMFDKINKKVKASHGKPILVDAVEAEYDGKDMELTYTKLKENLVRSESRMALVVKKALHYGLAKMIGANTYYYRELIRPFKDKESGIRWLLEE